LTLYIYKNSTLDRWYCTEFYGLEPLGYGSYIFTTSSRVDLLSKQSKWSVLGLFTYDQTKNSHNNSELDFEVSTWGNAYHTTNSQFVVQPFEIEKHVHRYEIPTLTSNNSNVTYVFYWSPDFIYFACYLGMFNGQYVNNPNIGNEYLTLIAEYNFTNKSGVPPPDNTIVHMNLWIANNTDTTHLTSQSAVVSGFWHFKMNFLDLTPNNSNHNTNPPKKGAFHFSYVSLSSLGMWVFWILFF